MSKGNRKTGFGGFVMLLLQWLFVVGLLLAMASQYIPPDVFWIPAFFGLSYPVWFLGNVFFTAFWIIKKRRYFLYPLIVMLSGYGLPRRFVGFGASKELMSVENTFKIMSYNVHDFDYYTQTYSKGNAALNTIMDYLKKEDPDVICFQEFYSNPLKKGKDNFKLFKKDTPYKYVSRFKYNNRTSFLFIVTYSKFPIVHNGFLNRAPGNRDITGIYSDIKINNNIIRVYNVHLQSTMITSQAFYLDKSYDVTQEKDIKELENAGRSIVGRMKRGYQKRSLQAELLRNHIDSSPYPVVLAGDFNDTPVSYAYHHTSGDLIDAFVESGSGWISTYDGKYPKMRIDYIFHDDYMASYAFWCDVVKASDHYPIHCVLDLSNLQENDR